MKSLLKKFTILWCLIGMGLGVSPNAQALSLSKSTPHVNLKLLTTTDKINSCQDMQVLLEFDIEKGWHIFSPAPGDIGLPTKVDWTLPKGYKISHVRWSLAQEINDDGLLLNVYADKAYYHALISPACSDNPSADFEATVYWQECADECIPQKHKFSFTLPVTKENVSPSKSWYKTLWNAERTFMLQEDKIPNLNSEPEFWLILLMAFGGGLILNLMPCIFPVLSLKAIALVKGAKNKKRAKSDALLYTVGVVASFLLMAFVLVAFRENGEKIGWGFQMQSPVFVSVLLAIFILILFMFLDLIKVQNPFTDPMVRLSVKARHFSSFFTGVFSVLIATPCTAPFMGIAIAYALTKPVFYYYPIFFSLALGYAAPFLFLGFYPKVLARLLPKPGKWMVTLKRIFVIPVFLTCVWLSWVLYNQLANRPDVNQFGVAWNKYNYETVTQAVNNGQKVFIDFTAKWCITCIANEKSTLNTQEFAKLAQEKNILLFKADWTNKDSQIAQALEHYGRNSIPLYVYYDGEKLQILPQILTPSIVAQYFK